MKILLTGSNGQIGTELKLLGAAETDISLIPTDLPELDITKAEQVDAAIGEHVPDLVINAAAYTAVDAAETDQDNAFAVNETGPRNLATACERARCPLVHISTDFVFDGAQSEAYREDAPTNPVNVYGASKLAGEQAVRTYCAQHIILRTAWLFSPWGKNFMKTMLTLMDQGKALTVVSDQRGSPTAAADVASALLQISRQLQQARDPAFGTYHYCGAGTTSWFGFATYIAQVRQEISGEHASVAAIATQEYPAPALRPRHSSLNCDRLQEIFGIKTVDWQTATTREVHRYMDSTSKGSHA